MGPRPLTRRALLRLAGLGAARLAVGCGDNTPPPLAGPAHAAAVLEPDAGSFLVAVWAAVARSCTVEVRAGDALVRSLRAELDAAGVAAIDVTGLAPSQAYQVTILADDGTRLGPHHVRTAPADDDPRPVRIAVSADIDPSPEFASDLFDQMVARAPELFVSLGDFPYTDNGPPAISVDEYRARHAATRADPRVRTWLESVGVRAIYDDHEFRNEWDGMFALVESARYAAATQVWDEFFPLRGVAGSEVRYRSWRWGAHLECFLLDCRRFRSANAVPDDERKTMLGATQRAWLLDAVARSTATFKLIFTSVPLDFGDGIDHWASYSHERDQILSALVGIPGVLFVSADQHWFAAHDHGQGVREIQVGPLARGVGTPTRTAPGVLFRAQRMNFALLEVEPGALVVSGIGAGGDVFYRQTLTAQDLTPSGPRL